MSQDSQWIIYMQLYFSCVTQLPDENEDCINQSSALGREKSLDKMEE